MAGTVWDQKKFKPGPDARRTGRPAGIRNHLNKAFLQDLLDEWHEHGRAALRIMRAEEPAMFVRVVASLVPRELILEHGIAADLDDDLLEQMIENLRQQLLTQAGAEPQKLLEAKENDYARVD
ncbi:MAG: hypothetical protein WAV78_38290 [Xanthobacteraceae bacterium]